MKSYKLRVGRIPYANLFPIFHYLEMKCKDAGYRFIRGVPSKLNRMIRENELDISPSSSIEYLRNKDRYMLIPSFSISSSGPIRSILLFSSLPLKELAGKTIALSSESETSIVMLKIVLQEFLKVRCDYVITDLHSVRNIMKSYPAVFHIGDTAMIEAKKLASSTGKNPAKYIYDLGELWEKETGLPFVYALWLVRKSSVGEKEDLIRKISHDLTEAKVYMKKKLSSIAHAAPQTKFLSEKELIEYWNLISYDLTDKHMEGLLLFEKFIRKVNG